MSTPSRDVLDGFLLAELLCGNKAAPAVLPGPTQVALQTRAAELSGLERRERAQQLVRALAPGAALDTSNADDADVEDIHPAERITDAALRDALALRTRAGSRRSRAAREREERNADRPPHEMEPA
ncbi:MAG: hypothetical protein KC417_03790 [Myxococcales bacterium]|nr:hypothetical protein [Myxococcales bacterium]